MRDFIGIRCEKQVWEKAQELADKQSHSLSRWIEIAMKEKIVRDTNVAKPIIDRIQKAREQLKKKK